MSEIDLNYKKYNNKSLAVWGNKAMYHDLIKGIGGRWNSRMKDKPGWILSIDKEPALKKLIDSLQRNSKLDNIASNVKSRKEQSKYHRSLSESEDEDEEEEEDEDEEEEEEDEEEKEDEQIKSKIVKNDKKKAQTSLVNTHEEEALRQKREEEKRKFEEEKRKFEEEHTNEKSSKKAAKKEERQRMKEQILRLEAEKAARHQAKKEEKLRLKKKEKKYREEIPSSYKTLTKKPSEFKKMFVQSSNDDNYSSSSSSFSSSTDDFPSPGSPKKRRGYKRETEEDYGELFVKMREMQRRLYEMELQNKKLKAQRR